VSGGKNCLKTPLLLASENGNTPTLEVLVKYGADLFYFDKNGHSALQLSQMSGNDSSSIALMSIIG
jgi:ankyrin repeat protein